MKKRKVGCNRLRWFVMEGRKVRCQLEETLAVTMIIVRQPKN